MPIGIGAESNFNWMLGGFFCQVQLTSFFYLQLTMTRAAKINESSLTDQVCRKFDELVTIRYR